LSSHHVLKVKRRIKAGSKKFDSLDLERVSDNDVKKLWYGEPMIIYTLMDQHDNGLVLDLTQMQNLARALDSAIKNERNDG